MKLSKKLCVCVVWMSSCFVVFTVDGATTKPPGSTSSATIPSTSTVASSSNSTGNDSETSSTSSMNVSSTVEPDNSSTITSSTTQPSTSISTTMQPTLCKNGTCSGNDSNCLNDTITQTCTLTGSDYCYQVVFINETDIYYEVGCMASCEYLHEDAAGDVTNTKRCCSTNLCNNELLSDPDPESSAIQTSMSCTTVILLLIVDYLIQN